MPGLTDSHMHTCQQLLKGKILDELPMIWTRIMLPFESTLTKSKVNLSTKLSSLEMIKSGTTSFIDAGGIFMDEAAEIYIKSGGAVDSVCSRLFNLSNTVSEPGVAETLRIAKVKQTTTNGIDSTSRFNINFRSFIHKYSTSIDKGSCSRLYHF